MYFSGFAAKKEKTVLVLQIRSTLCFDSTTREIGYQPIRLPGQLFGFLKAMLDNVRLTNKICKLIRSRGEKPAREIENIIHKSHESTSRCTVYGLSNANSCPQLLVH